MATNQSPYTSRMVDSTQKEETPNIYKYTASLTFVDGEDVHEIDAYSVKTVVIDHNYKEMNMPLIFITASIDKKVVDLMVQKQDSSTIILNIKRCISNSDMPDLYTDYINDKFIYFMSDDINKNEQLDYAGDNKNRADQFALTTFGLLSQDHVNKNKKVVNGIFNGPLSSIMYYLTSHLKVLIEPPTSNPTMSNIFIPPTNSVAKSLEYLNSLKVFYNTQYMFYIDFDCSYLMSMNGKAIKKKSEDIYNVLITIKNTFDEGSMTQGMIIDESAGMYKIDIMGIDAELADYYTSEKSFVKVKATKVDGSSSSSSISNTGSVITAKTKAIRISNGNTGLLDNMTNSLDSSSIQLLVQKTDIDGQVLTPNKKYTIKADDVYKSDRYNGTYMLIRKRELFIRDDEEFTMSTMLLFHKV